MKRDIFALYEQIYVLYIYIYIYMNIDKHMYSTFSTNMVNSLIVFFIIFDELFVY